MPGTIGRKVSDPLPLLNLFLKVGARVGVEVFTRSQIIGG